MTSLLYLPLFFFVGPLTGAWLRGWQSCCLRFSLELALYFSPFLMMAYASRFVPWFGQYPRLKKTLWWFGVVIWCMAAPISCGHALS